MESYQGVFSKSKGKEVQHSLKKKDKILYLKTMMYLNVSRLFIQLLREIRKKLKHVHASNNDKYKGPFEEQYRVYGIEHEKIVPRTL